MLRVTCLVGIFREVGWSNVSVVFLDNDHAMLSFLLALLIV